jgi:hypothetical protein
MGQVIAKNITRIIERLEANLWEVEQGQKRRIDALDLGAGADPAASPYELHNAQNDITYVVRCGLTYVQFDFGPDNTQQPVNFRVLPPHLVTRFTKDDATNLAKAMKTPAGQPGEAVHIDRALIDWHDTQLTALRQIEAIGRLLGMDS